MTLLQTIGSLVKTFVESKQGVIRIIDTKSNIENLDSETEGTLAYASDTENLLIYTGSGIWKII